ncbi:ComF family protein [Herbiconiux sp. UC225_62]|uniref:ComF family protein n=1 Tax=Herbiconiux sp. UC225_62 TaxID=3350168 RepID=UPI0036D2DF1A
MISLSPLVSPPVPGPHPPGASPAGVPQLFAHWLAEAAALLLPVSCAGCGVADHVVCPGCRAELSPRVTTVRAGPVPVPVAVALDYGGVVARVLSAVKEHGRTDALRPLAPAMRAALTGALIGCGVPDATIVTMPSARSAVRRRGYRPVDLLVRSAGYRVGRPAGLLLGRAIADQAGLSAAERRDNLRGAMRASETLRGRPVVLVDDVLTTGSTLAEGCRAVSDRGGMVIAATCLARTAKRKEIDGK